MTTPTPNQDSHPEGSTGGPSNPALVGKHVPAWSSAKEGCVLILRGYTLRTGLVVASVVGTLLSLVNEGATLSSGHIDVSSWLRIATNYVVPFLVSSIGYLSPFRKHRGRRSVPR